MTDKEKLIEKIQKMKQDADEKTASVFNEVIEQLNKEEYALIWADKKEKIVEECEKRIPVLKPDRAKTIDNEGENNILIEGDNYHCLKALSLVNKESIDIIYIDPPYNARNYTVSYKDSFVSYDGKRHDSWLSFMEKRLKLAHGLLKKDGAIFISIDESEMANLKLLCDRIFGEDNFLVNMIVINSLNGKQSSGGFACQHSYCLAYRKSDQFRLKGIPLSKEEIEEKYNYGTDEKGPYYVERLWKRGVGGRKEDAPSLYFPVWYNKEKDEILIDEEINEHNKDEYLQILPYHSKGVKGRWTWSKQKMMKEKDQLIVIKAADEYKLYKKVYATNEAGKKPQSIINQKLGRTELGSIELKKIMGRKNFEYPKYSGFIKYLISLHESKEAVVLDFFAGSGTTGQAVLDLNLEDKGRRRFILCTNNENVIYEKVTYPRIRTVISGIREDGSIYDEGRKGKLYCFKTAFMDDEKDIDDLLCIKENIFTLSDENKHYGHYSDNERHLFIVHDQKDYESIKEKMMKCKGKKIIYLKDISTECFKDISDLEIKKYPV